MTDDTGRGNLDTPLETTRRFESACNLAFQDKTLLRRALTHRSFVNESRDFLQADNERLEFLGDAVLDFVTGEYLYHRFPEMAEGALTSLRSALVRRETLARFATRLSLGDYLLLGRGEADTGGRTRPAILCAGFEALVGALYLDQDLGAVKGLLLPLLEPVLPSLAEAAANKDAKSRLQEWSQSELQTTPRYQTVGEEGPDHAKIFTVQVTLNGQVWGTGSGSSKRRASQEAAANALKNLRASQAAVTPARNGLDPSRPAG